MPISKIHSTLNVTLAALVTLFCFFNFFLIAKLTKKPLARSWLVLSELLIALYILCDFFNFFHDTEYFFLAISVHLASFILKSTHYLRLRSLMVVEMMFMVL